MEIPENDVRGWQNQHLYLICTLQGTLPQAGISHLQDLNVKVSGNLEGAFTLMPAHEETGVVETEADSRVCWQGLGCSETGGRSLCERDNSLGQKNLMESSGTTEQIFLFSSFFSCFSLLSTFTSTFLFSLPTIFYYPCIYLCHFVH